MNIFCVNLIWLIVLNFKFENINLKIKKFDMNDMKNNELILV